MEAKRHRGRAAIDENPGLILEVDVYEYSKLRIHFPLTNCLRV